MSRMKRPLISLGVLVVLTTAVTLIAIWLDFGPVAFFLSGIGVLVLSTLTDREAFYGPSPRSRR